MSLTNQISENIELDKIYDFVKDYFSQYSEEIIKEIIWRHWIYGTIDVVYKGEEIIAVCRWNISYDGMVCEVLDWVIKPGELGFRIMKHMIARNWRRFPGVKYLSFMRGRKYKNGKSKMYTIKQILKLKEF